MNTRRDFLKVLVAVPAAIIGWELGDSGEKTEPAVGELPEQSLHQPIYPGAVRVYIKEITDLGDVLDDGQMVSWSSSDVKFTPALGEIVQVEWDACGKEVRWRGLVIRHETL